MSKFIPSILLCVAAHPDDIEFCMAGSIAKWVKQGTQVHYLVCSDGCKGAKNAEQSQTIAKTRQQEQLDAAEYLGVKQVHFLDQVDGEVCCSQDLKKKIVKYIRTIKPDTVHCMDPTFFYCEDLNYINHGDHRAVGEATMDAVYPMARDGLYFPDLKLQPHTVKILLMTNLNKSNLEVDITDYFETKIQAILKHKSQTHDDEQRTVEYFENLNESEDNFIEKFTKIVFN